MTLLFLLLLLLVPYLMLTLLGKGASSFQMAPAKRARVGLSLFFLFTSIGHFIKTEEMAAMLPAAVPYRISIITLPEFSNCSALLVFGFLGSRDLRVSY